MRRQAWYPAEYYERRLTGSTMTVPGQGITIYSDNQMPVPAAVPFGISTTGSTPPEVVAQLNRAINEALADESVRRRLEELGFIPVGGTAEGYANDLAAETEKWRKVIKDSKIPPPA